MHMGRSTLNVYYFIVNGTATHMDFVVHNFNSYRETNALLDVGNTIIRAAIAPTGWSSVYPILHPPIPSISGTSRFIFLSSTKSRVTYL
jgi:hypothetical protein